MRVTMRTNITGFRNGEPWPAPGESFDVPDNEAEGLIANGYAKEAIDEAPTEHGDQTADADSDEGADPDSDEEAVDGPDETVAGSPADAEMIGIVGDPGETATLESAGDGILGDQIVNLDELDREQLLAYADEHDIDVNRRLGEAKLRDAIVSAPVPPVVTAE